MKIEELDLNLSDSNYGQELLNQLELLNESFHPFAMSEHILFLQGKKEMLEEIIQYIKRTL